MVITPDVEYVPAPPAVVVSPAEPTVVVPAPVPGTIVTAPAPTIFTEPRAIVRESVITRPATTERRIVTQPARPAIHPRTTAVRLTDTQRRTVYRTIRHERAVTAAAAPAVSYKVGAVLPEDVPVYALPQDVVYQVPALRDYDYTVIGNRVLLVEPESNTVVEEVY